MGNTLRQSDTTNLAVRGGGLINWCRPGPSVNLVVTLWIRHWIGFSTASNSGVKDGPEEYTLQDPEDGSITPVIYMLNNYYGTC
jgi:hypothetical protein